MPLNEAAGFRPSGLTPQQKREAEAAIYGLQETYLAPTLSHEEVERMRQIVASHDQNRPNAGIREFDLNNPPKVPYYHQEFPRLMYREGRTQVAHSHLDVKTAEENGWSKSPVAVLEAPEPQLDAASAAEAAAIDAKLIKRPR